MIRLFALFLFWMGFGPALAAEPPACGNRVQAFNIYEVRIKGKLVMRHSIFSPGDWSDASAFEGILIRASDKADSVVFETRRNEADTAPLESTQDSLKPWSRDKKYKTPRKIKPLSLVNRGAGSLRIELRKGTKILCRWTGRVNESH